MKRTALVLMTVWMSASLGGGNVKLAIAQVDSSLRERIIDNPDPGQPNYVLAGQNANLQYWKNADGAVGQALYRSADETVSVRTFYDEARGLPRKI